MQDAARSIQRKPRRKTVAEKMAALEKRYPKEKFIWLTPKLDMESELPEHLDLMIQSRKFSPAPDDGDVYILEKAGEKWDPDKRTKVPDEGFVSLAKPSIMALGQDAGVNFPKKRRVDDGSNPRLYEVEVTGGLVSLSGPIMMTKSKRIDLDLEREKLEFSAHSFPPKFIYVPGEKIAWGKATKEQKDSYIDYKVDKQMLQIRTFISEIAETKAQLRIIRDMLGIPSKFRPSTIGSKGFAVLRVIFAPHAQTKEERLMILENTQKMFSGAFMLEPAPEQDQTRRSLPRGVDEPEVGLLEEYYETEPEEEEPVPSEEDIQEAEEVGEEEEQEEAPEDKQEPEEKEKTNNIAYLKAIGELKKELQDIRGEMDGTSEYYMILSEEYGVKHSNEITDSADQAAFYRQLRDRVEDLEKSKKGGKKGGGK